MTTITIAQKQVELADPHNATDSGDVLTVLNAFFDALVRRDADGNYVPALAESWRVSDDARQWTFRLRQGVIFHNGDPVDASTVKYSIQRMARPDMGVTLGAPGVYAQYLADVQIDILDDYHIRLVTQKPMADLLDILVCGYIVPENVLKQDETSFAFRPVGTGAYQFESYLPGQEIIASANPSYFADRPANNRIRWKAYPSRNARLQAVVNGEASVATRLTAQTVGGMADNTGLTFIEFFDPTSYIYLLNSAKGVFSNPELRHAINFAIDRQEVVERVLGGDGQVLSGFLSPAHFGWDGGAQNLSFDPVRARQLLIAAGYRDDLIIDIDCPTSLPDEAEMLSKEIVRQLANIGVTANIHTVEDRTTYAHKVRKKEIHDMCVFDSSPLSTYRVLREKIDARTSGSWWQGYHNPLLERELDCAAGTVNLATRRRMYQRCYQLLQADPAWLYLYNHRYMTVISGRYPDLCMPSDGVLDVVNLPHLTRKHLLSEN